MSKTIALDLGTNSIGWAIRDEDKSEKQIIDAGVLTFEKGVAEVKGIETPKVAKRTESRGKRRNYQARKYRKQALLALLIDKEMCPLSLEELNRWRKYDNGRKYPKQQEFTNWLRLDFNGDGIADYENPYLLRASVVEGKEKSQYAIGRALYHLTQRRGFSGGKGDNPDEVKLIKQGSPDKGTKGRDEIKNLLDSKTLGQVYAEIEPHKERIRNRYNLRSDIAHELQAISAECNIDAKLFEKLHKAIIWQRPLRTQKGNVGKCTLEKGKNRCQISHPYFELFRAWSVITNIKIKPKDSSKREFKPLDDKQRKLVYDEIFMRKKPHFDFEDISKKLDKKGEFDFNYKNYQNISGCPVSAFLFNIFGDDWLNIKINKATAPNSKKDYYDIEDIWHVTATFDQEENVKAFAEKNLRLNKEQTEQFISLWEKHIPSGYGNLSLSAIKKILPRLLEGLIYSEAVMTANLNNVLERELSDEERKKINTRIKAEVNNYENEKELNNLVNALIADHLDLPERERFGYDENYELDESDKTEIEQILLESYGEKTWNDLGEQKQEEVRSKVSELYLVYLQSPVNSKKFIRTARRDERVKQILAEEFGASEKALEKLYHHSDTAIYSQSDKRDEQGKRYLNNPVPPANGFKNPMAMKTLYKLKFLVNYLIKVGKIDETTKVVVEVPRELTTANKRKGIEVWQRDREKENVEFARAIIELNSEKHLELNPEDPENVDKFRLWFDQLENRDEVYKSVQALKTDIDKYRLWKEQECRCMYTGKSISFTELYSGKYDFEHTIPASISFDNSLSNRTVCDARFNRDVKKKRIPTELANYSKEAGGYDAIEPRLRVWEEKVKLLNEKIKEFTRKAKYASTKDFKDSCIQKRHYCEFELEYWQRKLWTFTTLEFKAGWRNSQLVDTGIVSKYAFHYFKTVFDKVYVQKGTVTSMFRKIYEIQGDWEKKSREKHTHHAMDAATLTLIPTGHKREKEMQRYFEAQEAGTTYHAKPYSGFHQSEIKDIQEKTLINFLSEDRSLEQTKKFVRVRGQKILISEKDGVNQYRIATGDTVRGQLHKESFFGAIKEGVFENGKLVRDETGKVKQKDEIKYVIRKELKFGELGFTDKKQLEKIVDPIVRLKVLQHVGDRSLKEALAETIWMNKEKGIKIRHVRIELDRITEPLSIKEHEAAHLSSKDYKQNYYAENAAGANFRYAIYSEKEQYKPEVKVFRLIEAAKETQSGGKFQIPENLTVIKRGKETSLPLYATITVGSKVLIYKETPEELYEMNNTELSKRLYRVFKFRADDYRISLQHHLEARKDEELGNGDSKINFDTPSPRLLLSKSNLSILIEGKHFDIKPDGEIVFKSA